MPIGPRAPGDTRARTNSRSGRLLSAAVLCGGYARRGLALLTAFGLFAADRRAAWLRKIGWGWGLILLLAVAGPWMIAVTVVTTDGAFWSAAPEADGLALGLAPGRRPVRQLPADRP